MSSMFLCSLLCRWSNGCGNPWVPLPQGALDHLITRCEELEQGLACLKGEQAAKLSVGQGTL